MISDHESTSPNPGDDLAALNRRPLSSLQIGDLRRHGRIEEAWRELNRVLQAENPDAAERTICWLDHIAGRYGDDPSITSSVHFAAGCILWEYIHQQLHAHPDRLPVIWRELTDAEHTWLAVAERLFSSSMYQTGDRPGSPRSNASDLIKGGFAVCRCVVAAALEMSNQLPTGGSFLPGTTPWEAMAESFDEYHRFWTGKPLPPAAMESLPIEHEPLSTDGIFNPSRLEPHLGNVWGAFLHAARESSRVFTGVDVACGMVRRAFQWLSSDGRTTTSKSDTRSLWILFAGNGFGTCARLALTAESTDEAQLAAYPDPIRLGVTPLDASWRESFDSAATWVRNAHGDGGALRWKLEFLDPRMAREIAGLSPRRTAADQLRHPLQLEGGSASAGFAVLLQAFAENLPWDGRVAVSARATAVGHLLPIKGFWEKLDPALWEVYLRRQVDHFVIYREDHLTAGDWIQAMARDIGGPTSDFLQPVMSAAAAADVATARRQAAGKYAVAQLRIAGETRLRAVRSERSRKALRDGDLQSFTELHVPLKVRINEDGLLSPSTDVDDDDAPGSAADHARAHPAGRESADDHQKSRVVDFVDAFQEWLGQNEGRPLFVTAGPGMGKTWLVLQAAARYYLRFLQNWNDSPFLPIWVTAREMDDLASVDTGEAIAEIVKTRLRNARPEVVHAEKAALTMTYVVRSALAEGRLLLFVDGWDERSVDIGHNPEWLGRACDKARVVLFSRPTSTKPSAVVSTHWRLVALDYEPDEIPLFVKTWFGADDPRANELLRQLPAGSPLHHVLRTPLMAAMACWLCEDRGRLGGALDAAGMPTSLMHLPRNETGLLKLIIFAYLREARRDERHVQQKGNDANEGIPPHRIESECVLPLAQLAVGAFRGERLTFPPDQFDRREERLYTGQFGLLFWNGRKWEVIHQALAEWLTAYGIFRHFCTSGDLDEFQSDAFQEFVEKEQLRLLDPRWREVWAYFVGIAGDRTEPLPKVLMGRLGWTDEGKEAEDYLLYRDYRTLCRCLSQSGSSRAIRKLQREVADHSPDLIGVNPYLKEDVPLLVAGAPEIAAQCWSTTFAEMENKFGIAVRSHLTNVLSALAPQLKADGASTLFQQVFAIMTNDDCRLDRRTLTELLNVLVKRLESTHIPALLEPTLAEIHKEVGEMLRNLNEVLKSLAMRLEWPEASALFKQILKQMEMEVESVRRFDITEVLEVLAPQLRGDEASEFFERIFVQMEKEKYFGVRLRLLKVLAAQATRIGKNEALTFFTRTFSQMEIAEDNVALWHLTEVLKSLASRLEGGEASGLLKQTFPQMDSEKNRKMRWQMTEVFNALALRLEGNEASDYLKQALTRMKKEDGGVRLRLAEVGPVMASRLKKAEDVLALFRQTCTRIENEQDNDVRKHLAHALAALASRLIGSEEASALFKQTSTLIENEKDFCVRCHLADALAALASWLTGTNEALALFKQMSARIETEEESEVRLSMSYVLSALASRLTEDEALTLFKRTLARMETKEDSEVRQRMACVLSALASRLTEDEALTLFEQTLARMEKEEDSGMQWSLTQVLSALARRVEEDKASNLFEQTVAQMENEVDVDVRHWLDDVQEVLAPRIARVLALELPRSSHKLTPKVWRALADHHRLVIYRCGDVDELPNTVLELPDLG